MLFLAGVGSVPRTGPSQQIRPPRLFSSHSSPSTREVFLAEFRAGTTLFEQRDYSEAEQTFSRAHGEAAEQGDWNNAGRSLTCVGACRGSMFRYREALTAWLEARRESELVHDWVNLGGLSVNISSLYLLMGELDSAAQSAERAVGEAERGGFADGITRARMQLGVVCARQGRMAESAAEFRKAIALAERDGNEATAAEGWDHFGAELLARGEYQAADGALTEAYRLRSLHRLPKVDSSRFNLARLRLAQHDPATALRLSHAALDPRHRADSLVTRWELYHLRGLAHLELGNLQEAFRDFGLALEGARAWRLEVVPADFARVGSEIRLSEIYSSYIDAGNRLYLATGQRELMRETFQAAEENRAASLRALQALPGDWRERLPGKYWDSLAKLHAVEVSLLNTDTAAQHEQMRALRSAVLEMEAEAGAKTELGNTDLARRTQTALPADSVLLSFHMGERQSYLWAISREQFNLYRLGNATKLAEDVPAFAHAVSTGAPEAAREGERLYRALFGQLGIRLEQKPRWLLALDGGLYDIPLAALVAGWRGGRPVYLAEKHSLDVTTGAAGLGQGRPGEWRKLAGGRFLGIGDAIYNTADPRWKGRTEQPRSILPGLAFAESTASQAIFMPRLPGTAGEIEACARVWEGQGSGSRLLRGEDATPDRFRNALRDHPSAIHIAGHFREASVAPHASMIALSLSPKGSTQWLSPIEITRSRVAASLLVLSGCSSGRADALPGAGLMGLTRAWLAAGARSVIASHWPTVDDRGSLFAYFYKHFQENPEVGPAVALQQAQLDMLHAGGWRSAPQYWAGYFVNGDF